MATFLNRSLSLALFIGYVIAAQHLGTLALQVMIRLTGVLLLATACLWFPDAIGDCAGFIHFHRITTTSPGFLVRIVGWFILVVLPPIAWYLAFAT